MSDDTIALDGAPLCTVPDEEHMHLELGTRRVNDGDTLELALEGEFWVEVFVAGIYPDRQDSDRLLPSLQLNLRGGWCSLNHVPTHALFRWPDSKEAA